MDGSSIVKSLVSYGKCVHCPHVYTHVVHVGNGK